MEGDFLKEYKRRMFYFVPNPKSLSNIELKCSPKQREQIKRIEQTFLSAHEQLSHLLIFTNPSLIMQVKILQENYLLIQKEMISIIKETKSNDERNQQLKQREQYHFYLKLSCFINHLQDWSERLKTIRSLMKGNLIEKISDNEDILIYKFIKNKLAFEEFVSRQLTFFEMLDLFERYITVTEDKKPLQQAGINWHLSILRTFALNLENIEKQQYQTEDISVFLQINYKGMTAKELLAEPFVFSVCHQYCKWKAYLSSR